MSADSLPFSDQCAELHNAVCAATDNWTRNNTAYETSVLERLHAAGYEIKKVPLDDPWRGTR